MTHAFFKALLFLAAGSVIIGMHHDQDIRNMGGLRKYMPITWITSLLGSLALIGTPFFSGFYSKDSIIEAVHAVAPARRRLRVLRGADRRVRDGVLLLPHVLPRLPRQGALPPQALPGRARPRHATTTEHHAARVALGGDAAAGAAGDPVGRDRLPRRSSRCCSATSSRARSSSTERHPAMAELASTSTARRHGAARPSARCRSGWRWPAWSRPGSSTWRRTSRPRSPHLQAAGTRVLENKYYIDAFNEKSSLAAPAAGPGLWKGGDVGLIDGLVVNGSAAWSAGSGIAVRLLPDRLPLPLRAGDDRRRVRADDLAVVPGLALMWQSPEHGVQEHA
jgi:NADH-quinone oxidoreductase subunit L